MASNKLFHRGQRCELQIHTMAFEGKGISKIDTERGQYVVFVPNTIPGQKVWVKMVKVKSSFAEAKLLKVIEKSPEEVEQPYFSIPGAPYMNLPVERQHFYKQSTSIELFRRIGKIADSEDRLDEFIASPKSFHYRNKMEYSFAAVVSEDSSESPVDGFSLGFKKRGQFLIGEQLQGDSGMFDPQLENAMPRIAQWFINRDLAAWHPKKHEGFGRTLLAKRSFDEDGLLINLTTSSQQIEKFDAEAFKELLLDVLGDRLLGLVHTITDDISDRPTALPEDRTLIYGKDTIIEEISGLKFRISIDSFFQTNPASAERLYNKALDYVFESAPGDRPVVMDLFSGTGTITQLLAKRSQGKKIIGVELVPQAVEDARENARLNGLEKLKFYAADVGKFLNEHPQYKGKIDTVVMDPPRAGIAPKTLRKVIRLEAPRMVYISCNPATQARDIEILQEAGYELKKYSLVDQFPHTAHIESVALFEKI